MPDRKVLALFALCLSFVLPFGCGGSGSGNAPTYPSRTVKEPPMDGAAAISGRVVYQGTVPPRKLLRTADAWCNSGGRQFWTEEVVVGKENGLANVLVRIKKGLEPWTFAYDQSEAEIDQIGCVFVPHVKAVRAFQPVLFKSSDPVSHNVNSNSAKIPENKFNFSLSAVGMSRTMQFPKPETGVVVVCDVHTNMLMYLHVLDHPYFAVTDADGRWSFPKPVPPGRYVIEYIHERYGAKEGVLEVEPNSPMSKEYVWESN